MILKKVMGGMKADRIYIFMVLLSVLVAFYKIGWQLKFYLLPLGFFLLGLIFCLWRDRFSISLFFFLLPLINSLPDLVSLGYPYNYMCTILFLLAGIFVGFLFQKGKIIHQQRWLFPYLIFLGILFISVFFTFLRWSNLTIPSLAFLKDTLVEPSGTRLSFASIFPVVTLFLFSISPFTFFMIKRFNLKDSDIFRPLTYGYIGSILIALYQRFVNVEFLAQTHWGLKQNQYNGGFSDFNGLGLFSGVLALYGLIKMIEYAKEGKIDRKMVETIGLLFVSLVGIFLSGSRTSLIFIFAGILYFFITRKIRVKPKLIFAAILIVFVFIGGGTIKGRIQHMMKGFSELRNKGSFFQAVDRITNGRMTMIANGAEMCRDFPLSGVGAGNFLFYLKYQHFGETKYLEDLPLNQYLLFLSETGFFGLIFFLFFIIEVIRCRGNPGFYLIFLIMIGVLLINNFLWLPEGIILFWVVVAFMSPNKCTVQKGSLKRKRLLVTGCILAFIFFNILSMNRLHPRHLVENRGVLYQYGFWYQEQGDEGSFRWTRGSCGLYLSKTSARHFLISCQAPISHLKGKEQKVDIFWQGKLFKRLVFHDNDQRTVSITDSKAGFLELRVSPTFNLKAMGLGPESRNLGVQFFIKPKDI